MAEPRIVIELVDGSDCHVTSMPVSSFGSADVSRAVGEAAAMFIESFTRGEVERGETWNPAMWVWRMAEWKCSRG